MSANVPVLPIAGAAAVRGSFAVLALVTRWLKGLARARRHRRAAFALASLDHHMLADIGLTRADVSDAFSSRFWEDPTDVLRERADARRLPRRTPPRPTTPAATDAPPLQPYPQPTHRRALPML